MVLGSATPNPDPDRAGSAVAVLDGHDWVLVDCGRRATMRALTAGLDLTRLVAVFVTHHHSDHLSDMATIAIARRAAGATTPMTVVTPDGPASTFATTCLDAFADDCFTRQAVPEAGTRPTLDVVSFAPTLDVAPVHVDDGWLVASALVDHHPIDPAVGFRIERDGVVVLVSGDTCVCDSVRALAAGADVIVHEALLADRVAPSLLVWNATAQSVVARPAAHSNATSSPRRTPAVVGAIGSPSVAARPAGRLANRPTATSVRERCVSCVTDAGGEGPSCGISVSGTELCGDGCRYVRHDEHVRHDLT